MGKNTKESTFNQILDTVLKMIIGSAMLVGGFELLNSTNSVSVADTTIAYGLPMGVVLIGTVVWTVAKTIHEK